MPDYWPMFLIAHAHDSHGCQHFGQPDAPTLDGESAALEAAQSAYDLGAAWQEAEAALPEGWSVCRLEGGRRGWQAQAEPTPAYKRVRNSMGAQEASTWLGVGGRGDTQTAALRALAARLREARGEGS